MTYYGIQKHTLIDYPGEVACTLFTRGCNLRCPYCHNPQLVDKNSNLKPITIEEILDFLKKRKNLLGGVCITGGEPLLNKEIIEDIKKIKDLGFKVKIDTNGCFPDLLKKLEVDYIAMDLKSSFKKYKYVCVNNDVDLVISQIKETLSYLKTSKINHEVRTTVVPYIVELEDIPLIINEIRGVKKYVLAQFRPFNTLEPDWEEIMPYSQEILKEMQKIVINAGIPCEIRNL